MQNQTYLCFRFICAIPGKVGIDTSLYQSLLNLLPDVEVPQKVLDFANSPAGGSDHGIPSRY